MNRRLFSVTILVLMIIAAGHAGDITAVGVDTPDEPFGRTAPAAGLMARGTIYYVLTPTGESKITELWRYDFDAGCSEKVLDIEGKFVDYAQISGDGKYFFYRLDGYFRTKIGAVRLDSPPGSPREELVLHFDRKEAAAFYDDWAKKLYFGAFRRGKEPEDVLFSEGLFTVLRAKGITTGWVDFGQNKYEVVETPLGVPSAISEDYLYYGHHNYEKGIDKYWRTPKIGVKEEAVLVKGHPSACAPIFLNGEKACLFFGKKSDEPGQPLFLRFEDYSGNGPRPAVAEYQLPERTIPAYVQPPFDEKTGILIRKITLAADAKSGAVEDIFFLDALTWEVEYLFTIEDPPFKRVLSIAGWIAPPAVPGDKPERGLVHNLSPYY